LNVLDTSTGHGICRALTLAERPDKWQIRFKTTQFEVEKNSIARESPIIGES
jgi:hypothetical protein